MNQLLMILVIFSVAGCSHQMMYDNLQKDKRNNCIEDVPTSYAECLERTNKSYDEYERERKKILEKQK